MAPRGALTFTSAPPASVQADAPFGFTVQLRFAGGVPRAVAGIVVLVLLAGGPGTLSGSAVAATDGSGVATFSGLGLSTAGSVTLRIQADGHAFLTQAITVTGAAPATLQIAASGRHLTLNNTPFFAVGDSPWSAIVQLTPSEMDTYLDDTVAKHFNAVLVNLLEHKWTTNAPSTIDGISPFTGAPFATPRTAYFDRVELFLQKCKDRGLQVWLCTNYIGAGAGGGDPNPPGWWNEMVSAGATVLRTWGQFLADRYTNFDNIVWVHGGDEQPTLTAGNAALLRAIYLGITDRTTKWRHAYHCGGGTPGPNVESAQYWSGTATPPLDINNYTTQPSNYNSEPGRADTAWGRSPVIPFSHLEGGYEFMGGLVALNCRAMAYWSWCRGAFGVWFGNHPLWHFNGNPDSPGTAWPGHLNDPGRATFQFIREFVLGRGNWENSAPALGTTVITAGAESGSNLAVARRENAGQWVAVYKPTWVGKSVTIDMSKVGWTSVRVRWLDPTNGTYTTATGSPFANTGTQSFQPPGTNSAGESDWGLILDRQGAAPPG